MNKENRPAADLLPEENEGDPLGGGGALSPVSDVSWLGTAPNTIYLDPYSAAGIALTSGGSAPGGRHRVSYTPEDGVKAILVWVEDVTANAGEPDGYFELNAAGESDRPNPATPRTIDLSDPAFRPPLTLYVSSLHSQRFDLVIESYAGIAAGVVTGTALGQTRIPLAPPPVLTATVTMQAPDGTFSSRYRMVSFGNNQNDWARKIGAISVSSSGYILSATRVRSDSFQWPNGTTRYVPGVGRDAYLLRPEIGTTENYDARMFSQWPGQGQFRKIIEVGNSGGNGFIEYDRPFYPPLAAKDSLWIVDRCTMVRVLKSTPFEPLEYHGEFEPVLGRIYLDTWALGGNWFQGSSGSGVPRPHLDYTRRFVIQAYTHNANYPDDGDFESTPGDQAEVGATFPESNIQTFEIRVPPAPFIRNFRCTISPVVANMLRVDVMDTVGDVNSWRVYARIGSYPTVDGLFDGVVDEAYYLATGTRFRKQVDTTLDISSGDCYVILIPLTADGEPSMRSHQLRLNGPETVGMLYDLQVRPEDAGSSGPYHHRLTWSRNAAALDAAHSFRIEHTRKDEQGRSHGDNPTTILAIGNNSSVNTGSFLHDGTTAGAEIDKRYPASPPAVSDELTYLVTHVYTLIVVNTTFQEIARASVEFTDRFSNPYRPNVLLGTLSARLVSGGVLDDAGRVVEPVVVSLALSGARSTRFRASSTSFVSLIWFRYSIDGGVSWHFADLTQMGVIDTAHMGRHQIWGKVVDPAGTSTTIQYQAYWNDGSDSTQRGLTTASITLLLSNVAAPGPF